MHVLYRLLDSLDSNRNSSKLRNNNEYVHIIKIICLYNIQITDQPYPRGEIHVGGKNVAMGYYNDPEKTAEEFYEEDGTRWFRTGDIGEFHNDGVIKYADLLFSSSSTTWF